MPSPPPDDATSDRALDSSAPTAHAPARRTAPAAERFTPGTLLAGRYRIVAPIGRGGMGEIYRAEDLRLGQQVALKFLAGALSNDAVLLERLVEEVRIGRQISHPNVCRLYDIVEAEGHRFLVMELIDGEDLASLLRRVGRLPGDKVLEVARGLCAGLAAAHDKGVLHRDLKPGNVLVDGQGHARIADFGLAVLGGSHEAASFAGTLAYMAPEQLAGQPATPQSDVFALGLVLHEALTGKRAFDGKTLDELRAQHGRAEEIRFESGLDIDPGFRAAIARCLSGDPAQRPPSARAFMALLPGGDPLQAAILAGETPSPEMVAAAAEVGDIHPRQAWGGLLLGMVCLVAVVALQSQVEMHALVDLPKAPEVLDERARDVMARLGWEGVGGDSAAGFFVDTAEVAAIRERNPALSSVSPVRLQPGPLRYFFRWSPRSLMPNGWILVLPWLGPPELGRVRMRDPALDTPGMTLVSLDPRGHLTQFIGVPDPRATLAGAPPDWSALLHDAGFRFGALAPIAPRAVAPVDTDLKAAWTGSYPDQPGTVFRIEAAAFRGKVVYFDVFGPWVEESRSDAAGEAAGLAVALVVMFALALVMVFVGAQLVSRNLRLGRGDRRGAFRIALATFFLLTLAQFVRADHAIIRDEYALVVALLSQGCYAAILVWSAYIALEPAVRRRWPHALISSTRILQGRFGDPMVARDLLAGFVFAVAEMLVIQMSARAELALTGQPWLSNTAVLTALAAPRHVAYYLLLGPCLGIVFSVSLLFIRYIARTLLGSDRLASVALFLFMGTPILAQMTYPALDLVVAGAYAGLVLTCLLRFGMFGSAAQFAFFMALMRTPLTLDPSDWYFGRSALVLGGAAALIVAAAYRAIGGKPLLGRALSDD